MSTKLRVNKEPDVNYFKNGTTFQSSRKYRDDAKVLGMRLWKMQDEDDQQEGSQSDQSDQCGQIEEQNEDINEDKGPSRSPLFDFRGEDEGEGEIQNEEEEVNELVQSGDQGMTMDDNSIVVDSDNDEPVPDATPEGSIGENSLFSEEESLSGKLIPHISPLATSVARTLNGMNKGHHKPPPPEYRPAHNHQGHLNSAIPINGTVDPLDTISNSQTRFLQSRNGDLSFTHPRPTSTHRHVRNQSYPKLRDNAPTHQLSSSGEFRSTTTSLRDKETAAFQYHTGSSKGIEKRKTKFIAPNYTVSPNIRETKYRFLGALNQTPKSMQTPPAEPDLIYPSPDVMGGSDRRDIDEMQPEETSALSLGDLMNIDTNGDLVQRL
ncbi:hypothetical protein CPB86DRAFT_265192 [Serendipita vermifera]|nr:hypothetical protein CPB86DRAFT_265192 [Serendipita vermifera]